MTAEWPATGVISVFRGDRDNPELVGYTTFRLQRGVNRYMMTRPSPTKGPGDSFMVGEAEVIERKTAEGPRLTWHIVTGDPRDLDGFWPALGLN